MGEGNLFADATGVSRVDRLWAISPASIRGVIHGSLPNKSNAKKIGYVKGRPMIFQDKAVRDYIEQFEEAVWRSLKEIHPLPEDGELYFKALVHQDSMRRDLDAELLPDLIQKFNVIRNDRAIWEKKYRRAIDRENPRVEFLIAVWTSEMKAIPFWEEREGA